MMRLKNLIAIAAMTVSVRGQTPAGYTAVQAADGLAAYQVNCASCHLPDLAAATKPRRSPAAIS